MIVVVRATTHCNLACGFCAYDCRLAFPRTQIDEAAVARLLELLGDYRERNGESVLLSWLGGEPLLWRPWIKWSAAARQRGLRTSATTNGSTLHLAGVREAIVEHLDELTVSIDAPGTVHDALRGLPGLYQRAMRGLQELERQATQRSRASPLPHKGLRLRVNVVLMRQTLGSFAPLVRELATIGVDEISFNLLGGRDRPEFHAHSAATSAALDAFLHELPALHLELAASGTTLLGDAGYARRLAAATRGATWPTPECAPGEQFLFVDELGSIAPCAFTGPELGIPIDKVERIDDLAAHFRAHRGLARPRVCSDCPSTQVSGKFARSVPGVDLDAKALPESA